MQAFFSLINIIMASYPSGLREQFAKLSFIGSNPIDASFWPGWWNLVDTRDLKSLGHCGRAGSSPAPGTSSFLVGSK